MNTDRIVSLSAILISFTTLMVFIYQTNLSRQQQYLSVLPYLSVDNAYGGTPNFEIQLANKGIGPAFIESIVIFYKGKKYDMDLPTFLYQEIPGMDTINHIFHSNINEGQLIPSGTVISILQVDGSIKDANALAKLLSNLYKEEFGYELIYQSIYKERWMISTKYAIPKKL